MSLIRNLAFAGVSLIALSTPAFADSISDSRVQASGNDASDIVVMARRKEEKLQDVPKVVAVVGAADLQKNNIVKFEDIQGLTPGVNLQNSNNGLVQNTSMRGISFDVNSGMNSTVAFYWNDGGSEPNFVYQSMYDIGQIEILKGPQGTLRGAAAPSGSITVTTKAPDLYRVGGTVEGSVGNGFFGNNEKYALNLPIVQGKLAIRVAGIIDDNDGNGVQSAFKSLFPIKPYTRDWSERVSVRFEPTDNLQANFVWQHQVSHILNYEQTQSTCLFNQAVSCANATGNFFGSSPAYAGVISATQRLSTVSEPRIIRQDFDVFNARVDYHLLGQKLSYVGEYLISHLNAQNPYDQAAIYNANYSSGLTDYEGAPVRGQYETNEVRLASEERVAGLLDYTLGLYSFDQPTDVEIDNNPQIIPGFIYPYIVNYAPVPGNPATILQLVGQPNCTLYGTMYSCNGPGIQQRGDRKEKAAFGNITGHLLNDKLEVSAGIRFLKDTNVAHFFGPNASTAFLQSVGDQNASVKKTIWTASLSYHVTPDILGYFNAGSSFRQGINSVGPVALTAQDGGISAALASEFGYAKDESSKSYEVGLKSGFLNHRGIFNIAYYHQDFSNFQYSVPGFVWVVANNGSAVSVNGFLASVPAKIDGVEMDGSFRFTKELNAGFAFSYSNGRMTGGEIPCNGPNGAASALASSRGIITCVGSGPTAFNPRWNLSLHSEYTHQLNNTMTGYLRTQMTINPKNLYNPSAPYDSTESYMIANAFVGVKANDGLWDLSLFVKNLTNTQAILPVYGGNLPTNTALPSGLGGGQLGSAYSMVNITPPRQIGVTLRISYGSR